mgnify:CR=1 FL=1
MSSVPPSPAETPWLSDGQQRSWRAFLGGVTVLMDRLDRDLRNDHGVSLPEYEILVRLSEAPNRTLRMAELAERVALSRSRLTHTVKRLEADGILRRERCDEDGRGVQAVLTDDLRDWLMKELRYPVLAINTCIYWWALRQNGIDDKIDGFIVQVPLPKHIDEDKITEAIDPRKDVDGFHPINVGRLAVGDPDVLVLVQQDASYDRPALGLPQEVAVTKIDGAELIPIQQIQQHAPTQALPSCPFMNGDLPYEQDVRLGGGDIG